MRERMLNVAMGILVLCALVVTGLLVRREFFSTPAAPPAAMVSNWHDYAKGGRRIGPADAPVTIVEFSDFQCPACAKFAEHLRRLQEQYPQQIAVVYRHFPLPNHSSAISAARASECAAQQGKFAEYHDALFAAQDSIGTLSWAEFAREASVPDLRAFERCASSDAEVEVLRQDTIAGWELGVRATPTLLVNGARFDGIPSLEVLEASVRDALQENPSTRSDDWFGSRPN